MQGREEPSNFYDEVNDTSQRAELLGPDSDEGFYTSQLHDWVPLCPQLRDSGVRLYWIMRALVIEKRGPVRKLTLLQLCYLLPAKQVKPGEAAKPSSIARIRSLLSELSSVGLISTPEGKPIKTSSRASASAAPLRIRINDRPKPRYAGPRNAFALLDEVRMPAAQAAERAVAKERERAARRRAERTVVAGQISSPLDGAGQESSPRGQISSPRGQISSQDFGADLQKLDPPFRPSAKTLRSDRNSPSVRPSIQVDEAHEPDGRTERRGTERSDEETRPPEATPGMEVLLRVGRLTPDLALAGRVLTDQARKLDGRIAESEAAGDPWRISELASVLGAPLNDPIRVSAGAVISRRIDRLPRSPRTALPGQAAGATHREPSSTSPADRSVTSSVSRRVRAECPECGMDSPGGTLCASCLGWPTCEAGCGRRLQYGGPCEACAMSAHHRAISVSEAGGTCPGHNGPCGRPVVSLGLCARCRFKAEQAKVQSHAVWGAQVAEAASLVEAAEAGESRASAH